MKNQFKTKKEKYAREKLTRDSVENLSKNKI